MQLLRRFSATEDSEETRMKPIRKEIKRAIKKLETKLRCFRVVCSVPIYDDRDAVRGSRQVVEKHFESYNDAMRYLIDEDCKNPGDGYHYSIEYRGTPNVWIRTYSDPFAPVVIQEIPESEIPF